MGGSAFDSADGEAAHEMALNEKHDHHDGQHDADGSCRRNRPIADSSPPKEAIATGRVFVLMPVSTRANRNSLYESSS